MNNILYSKIMEALSQMPPETGGILGCKDDRLTCFYYDERGSRSEKRYTPDVDTLNQQIWTWQANDIAFAGIVHSHWTNEQLSAQDLRYARQVVRAFGYPIWMGVYVYTTKKLYMYRVSEDDIESM